ncbi:MAG TPA: hypothetical protein PLW34_06165 [Termitinemataceae bacterium]|nr:hypothetical protein [Termitinemataceae bacterium]HOM23128.1 hypothetical protein [Termitinemataceae bacterium]
MILHIFGQSGWQDKLRAYKIVCDGKVIGKIRDNQSVKIYIPAGSHEIYASLDW